MIAIRRLLPLLIVLLLTACAVPAAPVVPADVDTSADAPTDTPAPAEEPVTPAEDAVPAAEDPPAAEAKGEAIDIPSGGAIARALTTEPSGLDPHGPPGSGQNILLPYIFDTLVYRDADNNYHPFLAESWDIAEGGAEITFKLRDDVNFHDGTHMDADAVVFTFERFIELGSKSPVAGGLKSISSVEAVDDTTVRFSFEAPSAVFFSTISMPYAGILSPAAVEQYGEEFSLHPVGTGPFMLEDWQSGVAISLARNPEYAWGPKDVVNKVAPNIDQALFKVIPDASTQLAAFQAGETDIIFINQPGHLARLGQDASAQLTEASLNSLVYLGFNTAVVPFDEVLVRQAIAHAIDKEAILLIAAGGIGDVAYSPLASTLPGYDASLVDHEMAAYDPELAKSKLAEAGFTQDDDGSWSRDGRPLAFTLLTSTRAPNGDIATVIQAQLTAIGIQMEVQILDARAVLGAGTQGEYEVMLWRYGWNDSDVLNIYLASDRIGRTNRSHYANAEVDALLGQAMSELDADARADLYQQVQTLLMNDVPWIPLYEPVDVIAVRDAAQNVVIGPMGRVLLNDAYVVEQ